MHNPTPDKIEKKIIETSIHLFAEKGYQDAKLVDIMKKAKITKGVLYHYFSSKQQILGTILEQIWQKMADQMMDLSENTALDPLEKIDAMIDNTIDIFSKNPRLALVFFNEHNPLIRGRNDSLNAHYLHYLKAFGQIFTAGLRKNFISEQVDGRVFLFYVLGGLRNLINEWAFHPKIFDLNKIRDNVKAQIKHGILKW